MDFSLDSYRMLARQCAFAHRTQARDTAKVFFAELWERLDRETLQDHCDARLAFNAEFARAYRSGWQPGQTDTPASAPRYSDVLQRIHDTPFATAYDRKAKPAPRFGVYAGGPIGPGAAHTGAASSLAADCAAFYASKTA